MEQHPEQNQVPTEQPPKRRAFRINPFIFVIVLFLTAIASAGVTMLALTTGEEKVAQVIQPTERQEFSRLYDVYDQLQEQYYTDLDNCRNGRAHRFIHFCRNNDIFCCYFNDDQLYN